MAEHPQLTWGQVKNWAAQNGVPDDAVMAFDVQYRPELEPREAPVRDLDQSPAEEAFEDDPATPALFLLREQYDG
jgi:hypothetical protein